MNQIPKILKIRTVDLYVESIKRRLFDFVTVNINGERHVKQQQTLEILFGDEISEILYGGAAGGSKSWTGCCWLLFCALLFPGTRYFIGREELKRLRDSTLQTFYKVCKAYDVKKNVDFDYNGQDHFILFTNGSRIDLLDLKFKPSDPLYERYGSVEYTSGWIEEGGEVNFKAFDVLKTRINRLLNDFYGIKAKILVTCNPKKNWLYNYFYKPSVNGALRKGLAFVQALINDNPFRESGYIDQLNSISDIPTKERLKNGNWEYDDDPAVLMSYDAISNIFKNMHVLSIGQRFITADIARLGDDKTRIGVWDGLVLIKRLEFSGMRVDDVAANIRKISIEYRVPMSQVIVDADGVGGGVADILRCKEFYNASKPLNEENFDNLRSQMYFKLAEYVNAAKIYLMNIIFAEQDIISQELGAIKQKDIDSDGKKRAISRKEIIELIQHSPDYATMLMLRMWFEYRRVSNGAAMVGALR